MHSTLSLLSCIMKLLGTIIAPVPDGQDGGTSQYKLATGRVEAWRAYDVMKLCCMLLRED